MAVQFLLKITSIETYAEQLQVMSDIEITGYTQALPPDQSILPGNGVTVWTRTYRALSADHQGITQKCEFSKTSAPVHQCAALKGGGPRNEQHHKVRHVTIIYKFDYCKTHAFIMGQQYYKLLNSSKKAWNFVFGWSHLIWRSYDMSIIAS